METISDLRQLLKRFGTFIYTGHRLGDLELMEEEIREMHRLHVITNEDYQKALLILRKEVRGFQ